MGSQESIEVPFNRQSKQKPHRNNTQNHTTNMSNTLRPSIDPRQQADFDEDESREIADQIQSKSVFLIKVKELSLKNSRREKIPWTESSSTLVILEISAKSASKRWQMAEGCQYIVDKNSQSLAIWVADKQQLTFHKVSTLPSVRNCLPC